jgi:alkylation response protein AidB-like acyl-CoA dehydrogenase
VEAAVLAAGEAAEHAVSAALSTAAGLLASEQLGVAEWCLAATVDYVKQRRQFARPVGSFQALKHRLADLWAAIGQARTAARYAADCLAGGSPWGDPHPDTAVAVAMAQSMCAEVAVHAAEECIQLHGGIGMTWEHPAHLYLKRARADLVALGTPGRHRADLAHLVDLPPPP